MNSFTIYKRGVRFLFFRKKAESHADGQIVFLNEGITVREADYAIDAIASIHFSSFEDYSGRVINHGENKLSDGTDNAIALDLVNGQKITCNFKLTERYQIRDLREQLIHYHLAGKLDFFNLTAMLGIEDYNAIQNFKQTLSSYGK